MQPSPIETIFIEFKDRFVLTGLELTSTPGWPWTLRSSACLWNAGIKGTWYCPGLPKFFTVAKIFMVEHQDFLDRWNVLYYTFILQENKLYNLKNKIQKLSSPSKYFSLLHTETATVRKLYRVISVCSGTHSKLYRSWRATTPKELQTTHGVDHRNVLKQWFFQNCDLGETWGSLHTKTEEPAWVYDSDSFCKLANGSSRLDMKNLPLEQS